MGKSVWIISAIGVLLAVAAGIVVLFATNKKPDLANVPTSQTIESDIPQEPTQGNSLMDFLGKTTNQECTFSDVQTQAQGLVHTSNGKVHGEFRTQQNGTESLSQLIIDGENVYIWQEGQSEGFKMPITKIEEIAGTQAGQVGGVDINTKVNYDCKPWVVDESVFVLPVNVTFSDFSAMLEDLKSSFPEDAQVSPTGAATNCAVCDNLTGDSKTQCLAALGCQ